MLSRIETKVWAGLAGLMSGGALGSFVVWLLGVTVWDVPKDGAQADAAIAAVPWPVAALVPLVLAGLVGTGAAYSASPSNHAGNNATGTPMDDTSAGHDDDIPLLGNEIDTDPTTAQEG